ncbi:MAG: hypothetical protein U1E73_14185 [Planctomycetota bacterium]
MNHLIRSAAFALLVAGTPAVAQVKPEKAPSPWMNDFSLARSRARNEQRDLVMVLFGPAPDGSEARLEADILKSPEFVAEAGKTMLLARFDFPRDQSKLSDVDKQQAAMLLAKYPTRHLPAVWLLDQNVQAYARLAYDGVGAKAFAARLEEKRKAAVTAAAALARAATLQGPERAKALAEGLRCLDDDIVATVHYQEMLAAIQLDGDGALGIKPEFEAIAMDHALQPTAEQLAAELGQLVTQKQWEELDARIGKEQELHADGRWAKQLLTYLQGVRKADGDHDLAAALALLTTAHDLAPRSGLAPAIERRRLEVATAVEVEAEKQRKAEEARDKGKKKPGKGRG